MRIISPFRDYYDCVQASGQDRSVVYIRKPNKITYGTKDKYPLHISAWRKSCPFDDHGRPPMTVTVWFCGKFYSGFCITRLSYGSTQSQVKYFYSIEDVDDFVRTRTSDYVCDAYFHDKQPDRRKRKDFRMTHDYHRQIATRQEVIEQFEYLKSQDSACFGRIPDTSVPIILGYCGNNIYGPHSVETNGQLMPVEFYRIKPTQQAFQEIHQYLASQAVPMKPIPKLDDETMAEIKGFDKYSFRKEPTKRKRR